MWQCFPLCLFCLSIQLWKCGTFVYLDFLLGIKNQSLKIFPHFIQFLPQNYIVHNWLVVWCVQHLKTVESDRQCFSKMSSFIVFVLSAAQRYSGYFRKGGLTKPENIYVYDTGIRECDSSQLIDYIKKNVTNWSMIHRSSAPYYIRQLHP